MILSLQLDGEFLTKEGRLNKLGLGEELAQPRHMAYGKFVLTPANVNISNKKEIF